MAKLVKKVVGMSTTGISNITSGKTINKAGGEAFQLKDHERLVTGVLTCFFKEPKYYGDTSDEIVSCARQLIQQDPEFVARLACYARNEFHMRTISQVLAAEVAHGAKGNQIVRKMTAKVIERPDDMTNIVSYYITKFGKPITRSLRRGLADAFGQFNEYQLAKYKGTDDVVKLRDVLLLTRPKPANEEQAKLWKALIENTLETPETRETILSEHGQSKAVWEEMIDNKKLGYMALLRNLENMLKNNISSDHIKKVCDYLSNEKAVLNSKQLPFRFFSAYKMVQGGVSSGSVGKILDALETALAISVANLPRLTGTTFMTADVSGSMQTKLSEKSIISLKDIGVLLMSIGNGFCDSVIPSVFGSDFETLNLSSKAGILSNINYINGINVGFSTYAYKAIEHLLINRINVDRIIIFSDMQCYGTDTVDSLIRKYRSTINPNVWIHSIDLSGHGTTQTIANDKLNLIAGWSEKVLHFISMTENMGTSLVDTIKSYQI